MYINKVKLSEGLTQDDITVGKGNKISDKKINDLVLKGIKLSDKREILKNYVDNQLGEYLKSLGKNIKSEGREGNLDEDFSKDYTLEDVKKEYIRHKEEYSKIDSYNSRQIDKSYLMRWWLEDNWLLWDIIESDSFEYLGKEYKVKPVYLDSRDVVYWRKENAVHSYMVNNLQRGKDDCGEYILSKEFLTQFKEDLEGVLSGELDCKEVLPTKSGFFFGSIEYDEYYYKSLRYSYDEIEKLLKEYDEDIEEGYIYYYGSSW